MTVEPGNRALLDDVVGAAGYIVEVDLLSVLGRGHGEVLDLLQVVGCDQRAHGQLGRSEREASGGQSEVFRADALFFFQAEDGIRDHCVTGVQTCALPISPAASPTRSTWPSA